MSSRHSADHAAQAALTAPQNAPRRRRSLVQRDWSPDPYGEACTPDSGAQRPLVLTVRFPPSTNHLYATVRGRRVKTSEATAYAEHVRDAVWLWTKLHGDPPLPPYRLTIQLYPASRRRIDASNGIKCLEDGLFMGMGKNDKTVREVTCRIEDRDPLHPRAVVTLEHMEPAVRADAAQGEGRQDG